MLFAGEDQLELVDGNVQAERHRRLAVLGRRLRDHLHLQLVRVLAPTQEQRAGHQVADANLARAVDVALAMAQLQHPCGSPSP